MNQKGLSNEEYQLRLESVGIDPDTYGAQIQGLGVSHRFLPGHSFLPSQKGDDISYHREDGQLVVDLKKTADDKAKSLAQKEEAGGCPGALCRTHTLLFTVLRVS